MIDYKSTLSDKQQKEIKQLNKDQAILKAVSDAQIDLAGLQPLEVYKVILERINNTEQLID